LHINHQLSKTKHLIFYTEGRKKESYKGGMTDLWRQYFATTGKTKEDASLN